MKKFLVVLALFFIISNNVFAQEVVPQEEINLSSDSIKPVAAVMRAPMSVMPMSMPVMSAPISPMQPVPATVQSVPVAPVSKTEVPFDATITADRPTCLKLTLPQAIDYALKNNLEIKSSRLNIDKAKNDIKTAGRFQNPYINMFVNSGKAATDNPQNIGLIQPFEIGKRGPRKKLAQANFELTKGNVALAEFYLRLDVRQAYVDLVAAKSVLKILEEQKQLLVELYHVAQRKYEVGTAPEMDVIQAKMTLDLLVTQVNTARTTVDVARNNFNKTLDSIGFDTAEDYLPDQKDFIFLLTPRPQEQMPDFMKVANIAADKRIDLKNAKQDVEVARKNLVVVTRQRIPDIEIGGGLIFVPNSLATSRQNTEGYYVISNITNIPLFYQYVPEIKNAKIQVDQKELKYNALRHEALLNLCSTYEEFVTAQTNLNYYNDALLTESRRFLGMAKKSYEIGKTSITDLIFIQQSYRSILMGYTGSLSNYYNSWVDFLREVNDEEIKLDE